MALTHKNVKTHFVIQFLQALKTQNVQDMTVADKCYRGWKEFLGAYLAQRMRPAKKQQLRQRENRIKGFRAQWVIKFGTAKPSVWELIDINTQAMIALGTVSAIYEESLYRINGRTTPRAAAYYKSFCQGLQGLKEQLQQAEGYESSEDCLYTDGVGEDSDTDVPESEEENEF